MVTRVTALLLLFICVFTLGAVDFTYLDISSDFLVYRSEERFEVIGYEDGRYQHRSFLIDQIAENPEGFREFPLFGCIWTLVPGRDFALLSVSHDELMRQGNYLGSEMLGALIDGPPESIPFTPGVSGARDSSSLSEIVSGISLDYGAENLLHKVVQPYGDHYYWNSLSLPWAEGATGEGESEFIEIDFEEPVDSFLILNGYVDIGHQSLYRENNRVKRLRVTDLASKLSWDIVLPDRVAFEEVPLPTKVQYLRLQILEVYKGTKFNDTCISAIFGPVKAETISETDFQRIVAQYQ